MDLRELTNLEDAQHEVVTSMRRLDMVYLQAEEGSQRSHKVRPAEKNVVQIILNSLYSGGQQHSHLYLQSLGFLNTRITKMPPKTISSPSASLCRPCRSRSS